MNDSVTIFNYEMVNILKTISMLNGSDIDGDIIYLQGHKYFLYLLKNIYQENNPPSKPLSTQAWMWGNKNKHPTIVFADTREEAEQLLFMAYHKLGQLGIMEIHLKKIDFYKMYSYERKSLLNKIRIFFHIYKTPSTPIFIR